MENHEEIKLCLCGSQQEFSDCRGLSEETIERLHASIHEIGHLLTLPLEAQAHISLKNPCALCDGDEGNQKSVAHVGYDPNYALPLPIDIVYSLAGGASEVACGLNPTMQPKEFGDFPDGMENDLEDLRNHCDATDEKIWPELTKVLQDCFSEIVSQFRGVSEQMKGLSRLLREREELTSKELDLSFFDRAGMQSSRSHFRNGSPE